MLQKYHASDIQRVSSNTVNKRFISTITDELLSEALVLLELIFIRDGFFEVAAIGLLLFIHDKMLFRLFLWFALLRIDFRWLIALFKCEINDNNNKKDNALASSSVWLAQLVKSLAAPTHVHSCVQEVRVQSPEQTISTQDSSPPG